MNPLARPVLGALLASATGAIAQSPAGQGADAPPASPPPATREASEAPAFVPSEQVTADTVIAFPVDI